MSTSIYTLYIYTISTQVYPFNGELYTFYESPYLHRLDRDLNTLGRWDFYLHSIYNSSISITSYYPYFIYNISACYLCREDLTGLNLVSQASHPHYDEGGHTLTDHL